LHKLKQQIKFRRFVLQQEYDPPVFRFSKTSSNSLCQCMLMENLVKLVNATTDLEPELNMIPPESENDRFA